MVEVVVLLEIFGQRIAALLFGLKTNKQKTSERFMEKEHNSPALKPLERGAIVPPPCKTRERGRLGWNSRRRL